MDAVIIEGLEVYCNHGVFPEENRLGQKFIVNAVLSCDTRKAGLSDDLEKSIDYGKTCHFITKFMKENTYQLIEAVAENLAKELLVDIPALREITLEIKKPWAPIGLPLDTAAVKITRKWHTAYIALGSNMGNRSEYIDMAVDALDNDKNCVILKIADTIETKPYGGVEQDDFLNNCVEIQTLYYPDELLKRCKEIEKSAKREKTVHWGPRTLDVDILFYDDEVINQENLMIPHVDIQNRDFVLKPMNQIAPYMMHPVLHKRICELWDEYQKRQED